MSRRGGQAVTCLLRVRTRRWLLLCSWGALIWLARLRCSVTGLATACRFGGDSTAGAPFARLARVRTPLDRRAVVNKWLGDGRRKRTLGRLDTVV